MCPMFCGVATPCVKIVCWGCKGLLSGSLLHQSSFPFSYPVRGVICCLSGWFIGEILSFPVRTISYSGWLRA
uniref:Uncharacterized protein n=1 Tax=Rhizophora mucronata TaxID=61149 RepID=A0A2P2NZP0_RHIMU